MVKSQTDQKISGYVTEEKRELVRIKEQLNDKGKIMITHSKEDLTQRNFWIPEGNHYENDGIDAMYMFGSTWRGS